VQMAFAVSQVLGLPAGLYLSNLWDWHAPFLMIAGLCIPLLALIMWKMKPVDAHLAIQKDHSAFQHLVGTVSKQRHLRAFAATTLLATGGFMLMPFGSAFAVHNLGLTMDQLPLVYMVTGVCAMIAGPLIGRYSDRIGKYNLFVAGTVLTMILVVVYTNLGITPLWVVILLNTVLFVGITSRMISSSALMTAVPEPADRGAFMGVNSSVAQISGGFASALAGIIVVQTPSGMLQHYPTLGYVVVASMIVTIVMMYYINRMVNKKPQQVVVEPVLEPVV